MEFDEITNELDTWLDESITDIQDENDDIELETILKKFYIEKYEHAFIIRFGSHRGDFPRLAGSYLSDEYYILGSGEMSDGFVLADNDSKVPFSLEQLAYKYFLEDLMKDCKKGYVLDEIKVSNSDEMFKITVERILK